jgi:hypothetical protein
MLVPVLIFVVALSAGVMATARWLPDLAAGPVGGLAFFVVCGLIGAALGLLGLHIYSIVEELEHFPEGSPDQGLIVAAGIRTMISEVGGLVAFASIVYLLAPRPSDVDDDEPELEPTG